MWLFLQRGVASGSLYQPEVNLCHGLVRVVMSSWRNEKIVYGADKNIMGYSLYEDT